MAARRWQQLSTIRGRGSCNKIRIFSDLLSVRGPDFRWIGRIAQQVIKVAKQHPADRGSQVVPVLFAGTKLLTAILIASVAQFENLMNKKGQPVERKKVVR